MKKSELRQLIRKQIKESYVNEMQAVNKETGKDITRHILDYMKKKITKKEFEELTGLSKSKNVNEVADPSTLELVGALSTIIGGSLGIKLGMDLLNKIVDKALAATKYTATEILKIVKNNTAPLKAAAQEGKRAFVKKLMSLIINPTTTNSDIPFTIKRNEGTCGYDTDARTGRKLKTPGGL